MSFYNGLYNITPSILPPQSVPLEEKIAKPKTDADKTWGMKNMDALEAIGKSQFNANLRLIENYEMIKGRFIFNHYFHTEGYENMLNQLTAEFELPNYLRHYDIISQVINTMSGEWQKRPDIFKVVQIGEDASNEYLRTKVELTKEMVFKKIEAEINKRLIDKGIDLEKDNFNNEEEKNQYYTQISAMKEELTPTSIQKFMDVDFLTIAEMWGQHQKEYDREFFNLSEKEKVEFEDMCIADRAFRHYYLTSDYYNQETWNPVNVFFHKSPDTIYIEDGDYVGRVFNISINTIIDRYGHLMSKDDMEMLMGVYSKEDDKWEDKKYNWVYNNYLMPFQGYPAYDIMKQSWGVPFTSNGVPELDATMMASLQDNSFFRERDGFYFVTEAYWKSQKKIIKLTYLDEETNAIVVDLVDENFKIPKHFKESKYVFADEHEINTYTYTYINEVWRGIKINTGVDKRLKKDLYLRIEPNDFQFKGDTNLYGSKLPVCGQIFSVRNSKSMSIVDMMKPYQIAYNVCMNQIYQLMEKEIGMFVVMDVNMFPNSKDWGGEDSWDKWMLIAKQYGLLPADTSPQNIKNSMAASGGFLPKVLDLNLASQMISRINLAKFFEEQALKQVGFNQYRTGGYAASATATGVEQGISKSYSQTESHFTNFSNYLRRCTQMGLNISQYVQSKKPEVFVSYTKSDFSRAFIKILGSDIFLSMLGVFVSNSQELTRQLEMMRQYALTNNTAGLPPHEVMDIIASYSPKEIKNQLKKGYEKMMENIKNKQEQESQIAQNANEIKLKEIEADKELKREEFRNNIDVANIKAGVDIHKAELSSYPTEPIVDNSHLIQKEINNDSFKNSKLELDKEKLRIQAQIENRKLDLHQQKIMTDLEIQNKESRSVEVLKNK